MNRRKPTFLIAGDPGNRRTRSDPLLRTVFDNCGVPSPAIAYIGAASNDDRGFFAWVSRYFTTSGSGEVRLAPTARRFERRSFERTCEAADAVFISGGDVEEGMKVVARRGLAPFLSELYRGGKLLFGVSAGSIMLARAWVHWADDNDSGGSVFPCLGIADILCDTHGEEEDWGELRALLKLSPDSSIGYGIRAGSAVRVDPDGTVGPTGKIDSFVKRGDVVRRAKPGWRPCAVSLVVPRKPAVSRWPRTHKTGGDQSMANTSSGKAKKVSTEKAVGKGSKAAGIHAVAVGSRVTYNTGGHATRDRSPEYDKSTKALKAISKALGDAWCFASKNEPYQDHHGGGLWVMDDQGWFFVRNLVGIEWSAQFCADPAKIEILRLNAKRLYAGFPKSFTAFQELGIDLAALLESPIKNADDVGRWTDSICNASVPLPQRFHTGAVPKGGGVHNYPTPVTDIEHFCFDDFTLWVKDEEGQPAAVVPTNKRGEPGRTVKVMLATLGTKLQKAHQKAQRAGKHLVAGEKNSLAKQAFAKVKGPAPQA